MRFAIEFIRAPRPYGVDEADLPWERIPGHDDYSDEGEAWRAADEFDAAFDHMYIHRARAVANDLEPEQ